MRLKSHDDGIILTCVVKVYGHLVNNPIFYLGETIENPNVFLDHRGTGLVWQTVRSSLVQACFTLKAQVYFILSYASELKCDNFAIG